MIADLLPDPQSFQSIGWMVVILFSLVGGANQVMKLTDRFMPSQAQTNSIHPQPLMVSQAHEPVSQKAFEDHVIHSAEERKEIFSKIGGVERGGNARMEELRREMKNDFAGVHNRMNDLAEEMPRKVIELLKTTGVIK